MPTLDNVLASLEGVKASGGGFVARCPAHDDHNPSLSIRPREDGKVLLKCFAGCRYQQIVAALGGALLHRALELPAPELKAPADETQRIEWVQRIWRETREPRASILQDYLFGRGWTGEMPTTLCVGANPAELARTGIGLAIPASIRFHPRLWYAAGVYLPAMVAAIEDRDGCMVGVHRTYLKPDGTGKAEVEPNKKALGRERGGAVRLTACAPELVLCEGIETGLSILQATGLHVWAALGTSNLGQVELPAFVREVIIAADNDEPGMEAAGAAAKNYNARGSQVRIVSPQNEKADWNDVIRGESGCQPMT